MRIGLEVIGSEDEKQISSLVKQNGFDYGLCPILKQNTEPFLSDDPIDDELPRSLMLNDIVIQTPEVARSMLCCAANWVDVDSSEAKVQKISKSIFLKELNWIVHLGVSYVLMYLPTRISLIHFAKCLNDVLLHNIKVQVFFSL